MAQFQKALLGLQQVLGPHDPLPPSSRTSGREEDIDLPYEPTLDTFRLGGMNTGKYGREPSGAMEGLSSANSTRESTPVDALSTLQSSPGGDRVGGLLAGRQRQESLLNELTRNRELADTSGGRFAAGATAGDVGRLQKGLDTDPYFGTAERAKTADYTAQLREANLGGFATPQEAAARTQRMEQQKLDQPMALEKVKGLFGMDEARLKAEAAQKLQEGSGLPEYYRGQAELAKSQAGTGRPINSVTKSGVTFGQDKPINPALYGNLRQAQALYEKSKGLGGGDPVLQAQVDQIQREIDSQTGAQTGAPVDDTQELESYSVDIINDIDTKNLSWDQLQPFLDPSLTPIQKASLQAALKAKRGF